MQNKLLINVVTLLFQTVVHIFVFPTLRHFLQHLPPYQMCKLVFNLCNTQFYLNHNEILHFYGKALLCLRTFF